MANKPLVAVLMGSDSDASVMLEAKEMIETFGISCEVIISSAHRSPERTRRFSRSAERRGLKVVIAGAGGAAHLAGVIASDTILPVIGVPMESSSLKGLDSLLSTAQMPTGVPVATMAIGSVGARNAAILAAEIIALSDEAVRNKLKEYKKKLAKGVEERDRKLKKRISTKG